jgi:hypothetical protein
MLDGEFLVRLETGRLIPDDFLQSLDLAEPTA